MASIATDSQGTVNPAVQNAEHVALIACEECDYHNLQSAAGDIQSPPRATPSEQPEPVHVPTNPFKPRMVGYRPWPDHPPLQYLEHATHLWREFPELKVLQRFVTRHLPENRQSFSGRPQSSPLVVANIDSDETVKYHAIDLYDWHSFAVHAHVFAMQNCQTTIFPELQLIVVPDLEPLWLNRLGLCLTELDPFIFVSHLSSLNRKVSRRSRNFTVDSQLACGASEHRAKDYTLLTFECDVILVATAGGIKRSQDELDEMESAVKEHDCVEAFLRRELRTTSRHNFISPEPSNEICFKAASRLTVALFEKSEKRPATGKISFLDYELLRLKN